MDKFHTKIKITLALIAFFLLLIGGLFFVFRQRIVVMPTQPTAAAEFDVTLKPNSSLGQSFVARYSMLMGLEVEVVRVEGSSGTLIATLLSAPDASQKIAQVSIPMSELPQAGRYQIRFPVLQNSTDQPYFLRLEGQNMPANGAIVFRGNGPLTYFHGTLYDGQKPQDQQLQFNLLLRGDGLLFDLLGFAYQTLRLLLFSLLLFVLPGMALLLWMTPHLAGESRLGLLISPAISLALFPLLYLWFDIVGIPINRALLWLLVLISALFCGWGWRRLRQNIKLEPVEPVSLFVASQAEPDSDDGLTALSHPHLHRNNERWADVALFCLLLLLIFTRLWPIHVLEGPSWGDSVQHTVIAQLLVDNQGLFATWLPYAPYESLTTHFGFSAATALYALLSGESVMLSTLLMGQLLNILGILALYPLALYVTGSRWAGVGALLFAGLLSPMPAEYVNWGRYAQLSGQVVFPAGVLLFWFLLRQQTVRLSAILLTGMILAGMALCYYRVPIIFVLFFVAWGLLYALPIWRTDWKVWGLRLAQSLLVGVVGAGLLWPWVLNLSNSKLQEGVVAGITKQTPWENILNEYRQWLNVDIYVPQPLLLLCAVALLIALLRRQRWPALITLWTFFLFGSKATELINLPLANYIQTFAVLIMLYIPVGLLLGWLVGETIAMIGPRWQVFHPLLALLLIGLGVFGMSQRIGVIQSSYIMVTQPDLHAMQWIDESLPEEAHFLVNGFTIYNDFSAVGADGGWWLPLLTKRSNTMPPQYAMLNEQPISAGYTEQIVELVIDLRQQPLDSPDQLKRLCQEGITHIYSGQGQGLIGAGVDQMFKPIALEANPALIELYHRDQVRIFELDANVCTVE